MHGVILAYSERGANEKEIWQIPNLDTENWSDLVFKEWILDSHPQETAENSVDIGHFAEVHHYESIETVKPFNTDGPFLNARYSVVRPAGIGTKKSSKPVQAEFEIYKWGLGYSVVEAEIKEYGLQTRQFVFPSPIDGDKISLRIAMSIKKIENKATINPLATLLPEKLLRSIILNFSFKAYQHDVSQDFKIWNNKTYIDKPALSKGDGPVMQFRKWAEQFY